MINTTIKRWKRDALETGFSFRHGTDPESILIIRLAKRVAELAHELESMRERFTTSRRIESHD